MATDPEMTGFRARLAARELLIGSFLKTPTPHMVEIAARAGLDYVLIDAEHAPFTFRDLDLAVLAGRAASIDVVVRVPSATPHWIQQALDLGAAGVVVPHVSSAEQALAVVKAARFQNGLRGYSNSPRAGGYGTVGMAAHLANSDRSAAVIVQIEDPQAIENVEDIAAVAGIDALFIGRADLAATYGVEDLAAPVMVDACSRVMRAAQASRIPVASFYGDARAYTGALDTATMLVIGSDQSMLRTAWAAAARDVRNHTGGEPG